jgi:uncharacterized repeat protein (TIGR01451 family)
MSKSRFATSQLRFLVLLTVLVSMVSGTALAQVPFDPADDGTAYTVRSPNSPDDSPAQLYSIDQSTSPFTFTAIGGTAMLDVTPNDGLDNPIPIQLNNLGFRSTDRLLYALALNTMPITAGDVAGNYGLVKIDATGAIFPVAIPAPSPIPGLGSTTYRLPAGDITPDGTTMYINAQITSNATDANRRLYIVDLTASPVTATFIDKSITGSDALVNVADWAVGPDGNLYGVDATTSGAALIYQLNPTTGVMTIVPGSGNAGSIVGPRGGTLKGLPGGSTDPNFAYGGAWFNSDGRFFAYRNNGAIYEIDLDLDGSGGMNGAPLLISSQTGGPSSNYNDAAASLGDGGGAPLLTIEKTVTTATGTPPGVEELAINSGDTVKYLYVVKNTSDVGTLFNVTLVDDNGTPGNPGDDFTITLTSGLTEVDGDGNADDLAAGATATGEALVTISGSETVNNTATATGDDAGGLTRTDTDTATVTIQAPPVAIADLSLTKSVDNTTPNVGDNVVFTLTVTNDGPSASTGSTVSDALPSGYTYVSDNQGDDLADGTWDVGALANGASASIEVTATVLASGEYLNYAQIASDNEVDDDSTPGDNSSGDDDDATASVTPNAVADLSLSKSVDDATPNVGDDVTFTLTVTNDGPSASTGSTVSDALPSGYTYVSDNHAGAYVSGTGVWTIGALANTDSAALNITAEVLDSGEYSNYAQVATSDQDDSDSTPGDDSIDQDDDDTASVTPMSADLSLVKSVSDSTPNVGDVVTFTIKVSNAGPDAATNVSIADVVPAGYSTITNISGGGTESAGTITWSGLTVAVGDDQVILTFDATVEAPTGATDEYKNVVQVTASDQYDDDSTPDNDDGDQSEDDEDNASVTPPGHVELLKLTDGVIVGPDGTAWNFTLSGPGVSAGDTQDGFGIVDFDGIDLVPGETYTLCETGIPAGWTSEWMVDSDGDGIADTIIPMVNGVNTDPVGSDGYSNVYDPNYVAPPGQYTNDTRCVDFTVESGETLDFQIDNRFPGGDPRTIGFWKNWNTCSGGNQAATAAANGGADEGFYILNDILNNPGITIGILTMADTEEGCWQAVSLLDKSDIATNDKKSSDAAYNLAAQLLAATVNLSAGAETCDAVTDAVDLAQTLLVDIGFNGTGDYLRSKGRDRAQYNEANELAAILDSYNNGELCSGPSVWILNPTDGQILTTSDSSSVTIETSVSDVATVTQVEFLVDDVSLGVDTDGSDGWTRSWDFGSAVGGSSTVMAIATNDRYETGSAEVVVNIDTTSVGTPPTVSITSPVDGAVIGDGGYELVNYLVIMADAADSDDLVDRVEFFVNGSSIGEDIVDADGWSLEWNLTDVDDGQYALQAVATDQAGNATASDEIFVTVDNELDPPSGGGDLHVHDLSGSSTSGKGGKWHANVTVIIGDHTDPATELWLANATVEGVWSGAFSGTGSCVTDGSGQCAINKNNIRSGDMVTFQVTNVILDGYTYALDYHGLDEIEVFRP